MTRLIEVFPWSEKCATHIPQIDEQHKKLVDLLNSLANGLAHQADAIALNNIFNELADYAVYHFQTEENIWHRFVAEDICEAEHKVDHERFISDVLRFREAESTKPLNQTFEEALSFLTHWLACHILESVNPASRLNKPNSRPPRR
jgi:hemerythrin-like metal-binding protein